MGQSIPLGTVRAEALAKLLGTVGWGGPAAAGEVVQHSDGDWLVSVDLSWVVEIRRPDGVAVGRAKYVNPAVLVGLISADDGAGQAGPYRVTVQELPSHRRSRFRRLDLKAVNKLVTDACPGWRTEVALMPPPSTYAVVQP